MILYDELNHGGCTCSYRAPCPYCESAYEVCDECREPVESCTCEKELPAVDENTFFFGHESLPPPTMDDILGACKKVREILTEANAYGITHRYDIKHHPLLDTMGFETLPYPHWPWWTILWRKRLKRAWNRDPKNRVAVPLIYNIGGGLVCNKLGYDQLMALFSDGRKP